MGPLVTPASCPLPKLRVAFLLKNQHSCYYTPLAPQVAARTGISPHTGLGRGLALCDLTYSFLLLQVPEDGPTGPLPPRLDPRMSLKTTGLG